MLLFAVVVRVYVYSLALFLSHVLLVHVMCMWLQDLGFFLMHDTEVEIKVVRSGFLSCMPTVYISSSNIMFLLVAYPLYVVHAHVYST